MLPEPAAARPAPQADPLVAQATTDVMGTVSFFNEEKGFGMIKPDGGGPDIFVHFSEIKREGFKTLRAGQRVMYNVEAGQKGPQAANVRPE